jgi:hypothetical protein
VRAQDKMVVLSNCVPGSELVFNNWYDSVHIPDIFRGLQGYETAQRYELAARQLTKTKWRYVATYDVAANSMEVAQESIRTLRKKLALNDFAAADTLFVRNPGIESSSSAWFEFMIRIDAGIVDEDDDHILCVFSNAATGREVEFNNWYDEHAHDVVHKLEGFKTVERYALAESQLESPDYGFLNIYRIASGDLDLAQNSILSQRDERAEALRSGHAPLISTSDAMVEPHFGWWFSPITERFVKPLVVTKSINGRANSE